MQLAQSVSRHATENNVEERLFLHLAHTSCTAPSVSLINMFDKITTLAVVMVVVMVIALNIDIVATSPVKPPHSLASVQASTLLGNVGQQHRQPRSVTNLVDPSCKGRYDRDAWNELCHVCEDCDNLRREFEFQAKCRDGCFASEVFVDCLYDLGKDVDLYLEMASSLRG
ncbi:molt-inhibiting hormone-like isoform X2 [Portunus trituberculatus]|uniref:molt-inhibiting hormone-like isoform X2 n=1 Tax=Portunus trituberculatus TaxID=210409 RepID=UPI001E1D1806|nr:molt-inhibiting hormone-like isoform X2 [Portunus trituberculatus]